MPLLDRAYSLDKPSDVRALWDMNSHKVKLMLALVYSINDLQAKVGYLIRLERKADLVWKAHYAEQVGMERAKRLRMTAKLQQLCKLTGMTMTRQMGGRVKYIVTRTKKGQPRPPGALVDLNQKGLFVFADMYSEEALQNLVINEVMFREQE